MRFLRIGEPGSEQPVVLDEQGRYWSLASITTDIDAEFLGNDGVTRAASALRADELTPVDPTDQRIGAPIARPGKVLCIGLNYSDHAKETGATPPSEPVLFMKAPDTVVGPNDQVLVPRGSVKTDYEVELAVVIGRTGRYLDSPLDSDSVIAGYAVSNDVSEREFQLERGGQWDKGKSCETFNPLGPWLVTPDEVADPQQLGMRVWINGELRQNGNTRDMIFNVRHLVWYLSQFVVLRPGDVINTGTPAGVGMAQERFLRAGDVVELEIDGLGQARQVCGQA